MFRRSVQLIVRGRVPPPSEWSVTRRFFATDAAPPSGNQPSAPVKPAKRPPPRPVLVARTPLPAEPAEDTRKKGVSGASVGQPSSSIFGDPTKFTRRDWNFTPLPQRQKFMPIVGLGTWKSEPEKVRNAVAYALTKSGYSHIDCAHVYGNHREVGLGIRESGIARQNLWVTTKLWNTEHHPDRVEPACRRALEELGLAYLDLYLIHWPVSFKRIENSDGSSVNYPRNPDSPNGGALLDEGASLTATWRAMERLITRGLVRHIGVSNFSIEQLEQIMPPPQKGRVVSNFRPFTNQIECHPYLPQHELREFCRERGIKITAYSPLGSQNSHSGGVGPLNDPVVKSVALSAGCTPAQVLIRWAIQSGIEVIPKSTTPERIDENFKAATSVLLNAKHIDRLNTLSESLPPGTQRRFVNPVTFTPDGSPFFKD